MEIPKYSNSEWMDKIIKGDLDSLYKNLNLPSIFSAGTILYLKDSEGEKTYKVKNFGTTVKYIPSKEEYEWTIITDKGQIKIKYSLQTKSITAYKGYGEKENFEIVLKPSALWRLQLSRLRLAFGKSLNGILVENSLLNDVPRDIIECIGEKIEIAASENSLRNDIEGSIGGGKKKKRKSKRKKRKTKRRKSKRKKHKTKRRKS
tara:strand:+ start:443 stop:1054 length:612 start_codon:yes stop_codon:yes gene_type:complete